MRALLILTAILALSACSLIYKLPTRQGNVIDQKQVDQLALGMTRDQVRYLLGTAVAASPFTGNRWDYIGYYKSPRGEESRRAVTVFFDGDKVSRIDGQAAPETVTNLQPPDPKTVINQQKKEATEDSRAESAKGHDAGVIITPPNQTP
ncbi:MAG: outer membrane protein assembly factor BamE [Nevskiaceae bacterium]|nr:MAG: outer membrane protein assembly factor BamE [Nevskiaceae bacterium]